MNNLLMEPVKHIHDKEGMLFEVSRAFMLCGAVLLSIKLFYDA